MAEQPKNTKADPQDRRILVLEDDDNIRDMLKMSLQSEGFPVKVARDGRNVLQIATDFKPNLIISDVMMPGGGGYEVLRSLQGDTNTRATPVIIITGYSFDHSTKDMMLQEPNVKGFVEKPIRPTAFINKIHEILHTKSKDEKMLEENQSQTNRDVELGGPDTLF